MEYYIDEDDLSKGIKKESIFHLNLMAE